jgi:transcription elongation factor GreA
MTVRGFKKIQEELKQLKNVERPQVVAAISAARDFGDLSENAEYHAAKEKQGMIESRIVALEDKISRAEVIDTSKIDSKEIRFGACIRLVDCGEGKAEHKFQIVGSDEVDISNGLLPVTSPLAKALIGRQENDVVEVSTPGGIKLYEIIAIEYA